MRQILLVSIVSLVAAPASADMTATYQSAKFPLSMTIEIAANGDVRGTLPDRASYFIMRDGQGFMIQTTSKGTIVDRVTDLATANGEIAAKAMRSVASALRDRTGAFDIVERGTTTVVGRTGAAFFMKDTTGRFSPAPVAVISHDPALATLGVAMARQFQMSLTVQRQFSRPVGVNYDARKRLNL